MMNVTIKEVIVIRFVEGKERVVGKISMTLQSVWKGVMDFIVVQERLTVKVNNTSMNLLYDHMCLIL